MLGKIDGRRKRGWQRTRCLDGITILMDKSLSKLRELVMDRKAQRAAVHGVAKSQTWLSNWTELNWMVHLSSGVFLVERRLSNQSQVVLTIDFWKTQDHHHAPHSFPISYQNSSVQTRSFFAFSFSNNFQNKPSRWREVNNRTQILFHPNFPNPFLMSLKERNFGSQPHTAFDNSVLLWL